MSINILIDWKYEDNNYNLPVIQHLQRIISYFNKHYLIDMWIQMPHVRNYYSHGLRWISSAFEKYLKFHTKATLFELMSIKLQLSWINGICYGNSICNFFIEAGAVWLWYLTLSMQQLTHITWIYVWPDGTVITIVSNAPTLFTRIYSTTNVQFLDIFCKNIILHIQKVSEMAQPSVFKCFVHLNRWNCSNFLQFLHEITYNLRCTLRLTLNMHIWKKCNYAQN